jgi:cation transporter-like permease
MDPDNFVIPFETALTDTIFTGVMAGLVILFY